LIDSNKENPMLHRKTPPLRLLAVVIPLAFVAAACGDDGGSDTSVTVGSKDFTEQLVLGNMTYLLLDNAGYNVQDEIGLTGTNVVRDALEADDIDVYWEYLGTGWIEILGNEEGIPDKQELFEAMRDADAENDIAWLEPADFNNTYAIATNQENADEYGLESVSDIGRLLDEDPDAVTFCSGGEFRTRPDGLPGVEETYGFEIPSGNVSDVADALVYPEVADGGCTFGSVFATSGEIAHLDLVVLEDDEASWPLYYGAPTVRQEVLDENPEIADLLESLAAALDQDIMTELNAEVDVEERDPEEVAETWLEENGFLD
jgi:osmoprotectant transport system substrate-binding protein